MLVDSPVTSLPAVGESTAGKLAKLGINSVFDLLYHLPFRYEDRSLISNVKQVQAGEAVTIIGQISGIKNAYTKTGKIIQLASITDDSGSLSVLWFNQPFLQRVLKKGQQVALYGHVDFYQNKPALMSPDYEIPRSDGSLLHMGKIVPIYPETARLTSKWLRTRFSALLNNLPTSEILPPNLISPNWSQALKLVHQPESLEKVLLGKKRLAYDELFLLQLAAQLRKKSWGKTKLSHPFSIDQDRVLQFINTLPFSLTPSQNQSIKDILSDLASTKPMNRLLEGDVGSGKTVVAAVAAYVTQLNGFQTLLMAPTQILATQHFQTLTALFHPLNINVSLLTGSSKLTTEKSATCNIFVGTHALLSTKNQNLYQKVGLVVIDEQHRFGVAQRSLAAKLGSSPHTLTMTATPIPRTVALTMFGDLDLSVLSDKPLGRKTIKTWVVPESKRGSGYAWIQKEIITPGQQVIWICPFINDSETLTSVKAASSVFDQLKKDFPRLKLGLLHGKLTSKDKDEIISRFRAGDYHILVATPIVEVGLDIPNATLMVIEGAERFGLAQLHQMRGRVGRSDLQSYCLLFTTTDTESKRLKALEQHSSGLQLAEIDLKLRGPGEVYGDAQHGFPQFKVADYSDVALVEKAAADAKATLPVLDQYPLLKKLIKEDKITLIQPN